MKKRLLSLILALCIIISFSPSTLAANLPEVDVRTEGLTPAQPQEAPAEKPRDAGAERRTIYVSNEGTEEDDGATAETPTTLARATELANEGKKPVEIVVLGQVSVDTWTSPTVETTLRGGDENAELLFEYCSASDGAYNISLADALTIDDIKFNCNYTDYFFSRYYGTYTIVANGYPLVIASGVQYSYYTADTIVDGKTCSTSSCYVIGGGLDEDITGGTHVEIYTSLRYYNDDCTFRLPQKRLTAAWLRAVAEAEGYTPGDVSYIFCSAQRLLEMNRQWLGHDYFTDVITFDYSDRKGARIISGDIFIDVETVADNARQYGCTTLQEMRRVIVHGVLHLCGQGDKTPRTNAQMHRKEDKYLKFWETAQ